MSRETRYTPGPWEIDTETRPAEVCTIHGVPAMPTEGGLGQEWVYVRGEIGYWQADEEENLANAHLIAAAPDLYEALADLLAICDGDPDEPEEVKWARAALAKARGEQP